MKISALQKARAAYQPKLPQALTGTVKLCEGAATESVADQEAIKAFVSRQRDSYRKPYDRTVTELLSRDGTPPQKCVTYP